MIQVGSDVASDVVGRLVAVKWKKSQCDPGLWKGGLSGCGGAAVGEAKCTSPRVWFGHSKFELLTLLDAFFLFVSKSLWFPTGWRVGSDPFSVLQSNRN